MISVYHEVVHYSGHVQGVGFRYSAQQVAKEFEVSGFVQNLSDGRVRLEAEGRQSEVKAFLEEVAARMHGYIRSVERAGGMRGAEFSGFGIR